MERVTKAWEDAAMRVPEGGEPCSQERCKGITARTVHGAGLGLRLRAFALPSGRRFPLCVLCLRAGATRKWYSALFETDPGPEPVHEWVVEADVPGGYDSALCLGPVGTLGHCGVLGPFVRYDESALLVVPGVGFTQICVHHATVPRLLRANQRVGARPLGFHWLWRTAPALLYLALAREDLDIPVVRMYRACLLGSPNAGGPLMERTTLACESWVRGVIRASWEGVYPHCKGAGVGAAPESRYALKAFVREHASFLVERDSPELLEAMRRWFPGWDAMCANARAACDEIRAGGSRKVSLLTLRGPAQSWGSFIRARLKEPKWPAYSELTSEAKRAFEAGDEAGAWTLACRAPQAAAWDAWRLRFGTWAVPGSPPELANVVWYACGACGDLKNVFTLGGGCANVRLNLTSGKVRCYKKRAVGRRPALSHIRATQSTELAETGCRGEVLRLPFGANVTCVDFRPRVTCVKCQQALAPLDHARVVRGFQCDACLDPPQKPRCAVCEVEVPPDALGVRAFDDASGMTLRRFCKAHAKPKILRTRGSEVWSMDLLLETLLGSRRAVCA